MKKKLRIGVLVDSLSVPSWCYTMIEKIVQSNHSEIVLVVNKKTNTATKTSKSDTNLLYNLYLKFENKFFKANPNAFEPKKINTLVNSDIIEVTPKESKSSDELSLDDVNTIKNYDIDVFIKLGFKVLSGEILKAAKYGVWDYQHGDDNVIRGETSGTWEVLEQWTETGVILKILDKNSDEDYKLYESFSQTDKISIKKSRNNYYWKASSFLPRRLKDLYDQGSELFFKNTKKYNADPYFYYNKQYKKPTNLEMISAFIRNYGTAIKRNINAFFYFDQWILLFKIEKKEVLSKSFFKFKRILPPKDRFWADPFIYFKNNKYYIFIEELLYKENKGKIAVIEMDEEGNYTEPKVIIEENYHLSYPFLIEENNQLFMIPESASNNTISLYKCVEFPLKWEFHKNLMENVKAVDTTIIKYNNKYWLFCNIIENKGASSYDELFLFYSNDLLNESFKPHPQNPIVSDVKAARPAGNIFEYNDKLYRPAQNCVKVYGYGMQIREIIELTETKYEEREVQSIYPNWDKDLIATHTLNNNKRLTVIDAMIKRRK